ncbi:SMI1/KNR4 family protein [Inquilinus sp. KBS0705]|nr:SMI1/KNR4 family protein [Inquilinus sp. KBS0705]
MADIIKHSDHIIAELTKFDSEIALLGPPITDNRLEDFERHINLKLPLDFKYMLSVHNGISLAGVEIYGIDEALQGSSLDAVYKFEHFEVGHKMPAHFLPFSPDGRGNHYCLNLSKIKDDQCPVVFWQWDFEYESIDDVEECNINFLSWVKEVMIGWTLEDYNYDGTEKK